MKYIIFSILLLFGTKAISRNLVETKKKYFHYKGAPGFVNIIGGGRCYIYFGETLQVKNFEGNRFILFGF